MITLKHLQDFKALGFVISDLIIDAFINFFELPPVYANPKNMNGKINHKYRLSVFRTF